jgi:predicted HicB family RNase H-like nuclease
MDETEIRITARLPAHLHERLTRAAERHRRSLNAQLLVYLERGLDRDDKGEDHDDQR